MSQKNYTTAGLNALLRVLEKATPENQPSEAVLSAYLKLTEHSEAPTQKEIADLRAEVEKLRRGQASIPNPVQNRRLIRKIQRRKHA